MNEIKKIKAELVSKLEREKGNASTKLADLKKAFNDTYTLQPL